MRNLFSESSSTTRRGSVIETLESRIAPAGIIISVGDHTQDDTEYSDAPFKNAATEAAAGDPIAQVLGANADVYYVKMTTGDRMDIFSPAGYSAFIAGPANAAGDATQIKGTIIAVFKDLNHDNDVDANELVGLSFGKNVSVQVSGTVNGDVVANYNDLTGKLGGSSEAPGAAKDLLKNPITFFGAAAVKGAIIAGGDILGVNVTNDVNQILTGSAVNTAGPGATPYKYNINGSSALSGDTTFDPSLTFPAPGKRGPNISHVGVGDIITKVQAGDGGAQAIGGSIIDISIKADSTGWLVQAGAGGNGIAGAAKGGPGGKVSTLLSYGFNEGQEDQSQNSVGGMKVIGGNGGTAFGGSTSAGGNGGDVTGISIGYEKLGGVTKRSINAMNDAVVVQGGIGGDGKIGGKGGNVLNDKAFAGPVGVGNDISFLGGAGGKSTVANGKSGLGGSVKTVEALSLDVTGSRVIFKAGDGGDTGGGISAGGGGGSVTGLTIAAASFQITSGTGALGTTGGNAGNVSDVLAKRVSDAIYARNVKVDAGQGGQGISKKGGKGGFISGVTVLDSDLRQFDINQAPLAANGGASKIGPGGVGGDVSGIVVVDQLDDITYANEVAMHIRAGDGAAGGNVGPTGGNGGNGGSIKGNNVITGAHLSASVTAGIGGAAPFKGKGGMGGSISNFAFSSFGQVAGVDGSASVTSGTGGAGIGNGAGGFGGALNNVTLHTDGVIVATAGAGGNGGAAGAAGSGGSVTKGALISEIQSVQITAGNAGLAGSKKGVGGSVSGVNILAETSIAVTGGNGFAGGAGGNLNALGVTSPSLVGGPSQSLTLTAGNGSGNTTAAGSGGSISNIDGYIATAGMTMLQGGTGGAGGTKAASGGSITEVNFLGGGSATAEVRIEAGSATDNATALKGGAGGKVSGIGMGLHAASTTDSQSIYLDAIVRHIAAGNGGAADPVKGTGGLGGSVTEVRVNHDIGVRSGAVFGFNTMGGIFAGTGGAGAKPGLAGDVTGISADGIAAILAGRLNNGDTINAANLAQTVTDIVLNGSVSSVVDTTGKYYNFTAADPAHNLQKANILGAVVSPGSPGAVYPTPPHANTFDVGEYVDSGADNPGVFGVGDATNASTDGFVAAHHFVDAKGVVSVRPEALLTDDPAHAGQFQFIDLNNTNGQKIIA